MQRPKPPHPQIPPNELLGLARGNRRNRLSLRAAERAIGRSKKALAAGRGGGAAAVGGAGAGAETGGEAAPAPAPEPFLLARDGRTLRPPKGARKLAAEHRELERQLLEMPEPGADANVARLRRVMEQRPGSGAETFEIHDLKS